MHHTESDEILLVHVDQAIAQVNKVVIELFNPERKHEKTIYVLDTPPDPF